MDRWVLGSERAERRSSRGMALFLIGVVHRDPNGYEKLLRVLEDLAPEAVTVELSPLGLLWREKNRKRLAEKLETLAKGFSPDALDHPEVVLLKRALELPFEYLASCRYAGQRGLAVHLVDVNWISRRELPLMEEAITEENLEYLLRKDPFDIEALVNSAYRRAWKCIEEGRSLIEIGLEPPWSTPIGALRERILACRIEKIVSMCERVAHVGGWVHMAVDNTGKSMASLLGNLRPKKILLRQ